MLFYLAQACGIISLVLTVTSVQFNFKEKIIFINMLANIVCAIQYFLLSAFTGALMSIVNGLRCFTFYMFKKKNKKPNIFVLLFFEIVTLGLGIFTWQSAWSLIPISMSMLFTFCTWQDNVQIVRMGSGIAGLGWTAYNIVVGAFTGAFQQFCQFVSALIALIKGRRKRIAEQRAEQRDLGKNKEENLQVVYNPLIAQKDEENKNQQ